MCGASFGVAAFVTKAYAPSWARHFRNEDTSARSASQSDCSFAGSLRLHPKVRAIAVAIIARSIIFAIIVLNVGALTRCNYIKNLVAPTEVGLKCATQYFILRPEPEIEAWAEAVLLGRMCNRNQLLFLKGVFQLVAAVA